MNSTKKIVEIIDDEDDIVQCLSERITDDHPDVFVYAGSKCTGLKHAPDLLIIDYLMRGKTGCQCIKQCIGKGHFPKIIIWSAFKELLDSSEIAEVTELNKNINIVQKPDWKALDLAIKNALYGA